MNNKLQNFIKLLGITVLTGISSIADAQPTPPPVLNWSQAGPILTAGRARNMVVDKADPSGNTLYAGSASSGLFKTTDGGSNWFPVNDQSDVRNISYLAQDVNNVLWVATGEGFLRYGQKLKAQRGTGLYKLTGSQLTNVKDSLAVGAVINRIACSPTDASKIALATNLGILISTDGGQSFNLANGIVNITNTWFGMDVKFDGAGLLYCTIGNERGAPFQNISSRVYKSTDASLSNFVDKTPPLLTLPSSSRFGRIELAIAPSDNQVVYASVANKNTSSTGVAVPASASLLAVYASYDAGNTWVLLHVGSSAIDPLSNGGTIASGDYAHVITVTPTNPHQFFMGGYSLYYFQRTNNSTTNPLGVWLQLGFNFAINTPAYLHENIHDIKILGSSSTNARLYVVTDAGIYRSVDISNGFPSFQPFYKGFATGQFNSVSIEAMPQSANAATATDGQDISSNDGFIGGTGGNGLNYFSGRYALNALSQESNYLNGEVYNAEFSKILPKAAFATVGSSGNIFRSADVRNSEFVLATVNNYTGLLSQVTPNSSGFGNSGFSNVSGTPFRLWENYGQVKKTPDSLVFYNDSLRVFNGFDNVQDMITRVTFTFSAGRPNKFALIDSIAIRTSTVLGISPENVGVPWTVSDRKDVYLKLAGNYSVSPTQTLFIPSITGSVGPLSAASVTLNSAANLDVISVTFTAPPFANKGTAPPAVADPSDYYRMFATVFYKYKAGDSITLTDNSISTRTTRVTFTLSTPLRWSKSVLNGPKPYFGETNPPQKVPAPISARIALVYNSSTITGGKYAVVVSKAPLALNDPMNFVRVSQSGALTTDATGAPVNTPITIPGKPTLLEWSKGGTELYYATDSNKVYRVSNINTIMDLSSASYNGKLYNDIFRYNSNPNATPVVNPVSPFRTTLLGSFTKPISSITISGRDSILMITLDDDSPNGKRVMRSTADCRKSDFSNIGFSDKTGNLPAAKTYCSLIEKDNVTMAFVGTDEGLYFSGDVSASTPNWAYVNTLANSTNAHLPKVQVFDIKQQTMERWECYNSGKIYVATNGRGVWKNESFFKPYIVSVNELAPEKMDAPLALFPNPTNSGVTAKFAVGDNESVSLLVMDINGRLVKQHDLGKLYSGEAIYTFDTAELTSGIYIVNISGTSGMKRVGKLIVTK